MNGFRMDMKARSLAAAQVGYALGAALLMTAIALVGVLVVHVLVLLVDPAEVQNPSLLTIAVFFSLVGGFGTMVGIETTRQQERHAQLEATLPLGSGQLRGGRLGLELLGLAVFSAPTVLSLLIHSFLGMADYWVIFPAVLGTYLIASSLGGLAVDWLPYGAKLAWGIIALPFLLVFVVDDHQSLQDLIEGVLWPGLALLAVGLLLMLLRRGRGPAVRLDGESSYE